MFVQITLLLFIFPIKKIVDKLVNIPYRRGKKPLKIYYRGKNALSKVPPRKPPPPQKKAFLRKMEAVLKARYDRMNYQTAQRRRTAYC